MRRFPETCLCLFLCAGMAWSATTTPKPERKWHDIGKMLHTKAATRKAGKARDQFCTSECKKKGAKKKQDLGACKEACTFGRS